MSDLDFYTLLTIILGAFSLDIGVRYAMWTPKARSLELLPMVGGIAGLEFFLAVASFGRGISLMVFDGTGVYPSLFRHVLLAGVIGLILANLTLLIPVLRINHGLSWRRVTVALAWRMAFIIIMAGALVLDQQMLRDEFYP